MPGDDDVVNLFEGKRKVIAAKQRPGSGPGGSFPRGPGSQ